MSGDMKFACGCGALERLRQAMQDKNAACLRQDLAKLPHESKAGITRQGYQ
jgi:hypothetical protein